MDDGHRVLHWIEENGHTVGDIAALLGYSRQTLSTSLNQNRISERLAQALYEHFKLRVTATLPDATTSSRRGPGRFRVPRPSKLDAFRDDIAQCLQQGLKQTEIAKKYGTTDSNLHDWLKRHGLGRDRVEE